LLLLRQPGGDSAHAEEIDALTRRQKDRRRLCRLAQYLDLDTSLVRILWFFITLACGIAPGIVAYVLGWIIIPQEPLLLPVATSQQAVTG